LGQIRDLAQQLKSSPVGKEVPELREGLEELEELARLEVMGDEIEEAGLILEGHRAEFEEMMADPPTAMERALQLFSEERFASMRYSADDLQRAFEAVGYLSPFGREFSEEEMETMVAVTLHLAGDRENQQRLTRQLMMALPEYVAAGRYRDGWLIQHSAYLMAEHPKESNPFLFVMFHLAFDEWGDQVADEQEALMQELGLAPSALRGVGIHEMEGLFEQLVADPRKKARVEAFYEAHPELADQATARMMELERGALKLLERDDAAHLFLSVEELAPWLPVLQERFAPLIAQIREAALRGEQPDPETAGAMKEQMVKLTREMAGAVFTPERTDQLVGDLKDYQRSLGQAGEREEAAWAYGALASIRGDASPTDQPFLLAICFASLRRIMREAAERAGGAQEGLG
jgi:hypothetical protein